MTVKTVRYKDLTPEMYAEYKDCMWGPPERERYTSDDLDEVIGEIVCAELPGSPLPETIEVVAMRRMTIEIDGDMILDDVLTSFDEEYGDPDGDPPERTPAIVAAAEKLAEVINAEYKPWACECVLLVTVDVRAWCKTEAPEYLTTAVNES